MTTPTPTTPSPTPKPGSAPRPSQDEVVKKDKKLRENLKEKDIDNMIDDSFPASDPPSTY